MEYDVNNDGQYTVISLSGEVDLHYSPTARKQILKYLGNNNNVLVDLSGVEYIDSSGVASLVEGYQLAKQNSLVFGLINPSESSMHVLALARLDKIFPIYKSVDECTSKNAG